MGVSRFMGVTHGLSQQHTLQQCRLALQGTHRCSDVSVVDASVQHTLAHPRPHTLAPYLLSLGSRGASDGLGQKTEWGSEQGCIGMAPPHPGQEHWTRQLCTHLPWSSSIPLLSLGTSRPRRSW